ncbi:MAG: hypothetical protein E6I87_08880 [Chloroflexi bacterium]|nr:MAG: hypothetical protein E6I87_08880 [Chloroflexota bacterium]
MSLGAELEPHDSAIAILLRRFADAVRLGKHEETRAYAAAVDPRALSEMLVNRRSVFWAILEVARNVLVFAPIAVTWYGLSAASLAYATLLEQRPELITRPFLLLWQEGFDGAGGVLKFSTVAEIDASLIGLLIVVSLAIHFRSELRDPLARARALLKESEIRGLIGHATSLASNDISGPDAERLLDEMVAEERRIYERAMEREQQLFDLEGTVRELHRAADKLMRAAEKLHGSSENEEPPHLSQLGKGRR